MVRTAHEEYGDRWEDSLAPEAAEGETEFRPS